MLRSLRNKIRKASVLSGLLFTAACGSSDVLAPPAPVVPAGPEAGLIADLGGLVGGTVNKLLTTVNVLARLPLNLGGPVEVTKTIGRQGGTIEMPSQGLRFVVPPGALDSNTKITIKAIPGGVVAYEFQPHGLQFKVPAQFQQNLRFTLMLPWQNLDGGYFKDADQIDVKKKKATVNEIIQGRSANGWYTFPIKHFSGYLMSCA